MDTINHQELAKIRVPERNSLAENVLIRLLDGPRAAPGLVRLMEKQHAGRKNKSRSDGEMVTLGGMYRAVNRLIADGLVTIDVTERDVSEDMQRLQAKVARLVEGSPARSEPATARPFRLTKLGEEYAGWIKERQRLEGHNAIRPADLVHVSKFVLQRLKNLVAAD